MIKHAHKRPKLFTDGRQRPVDRNDRARLIFLAKAARRRGELTRAAVEIFDALIYAFANLRDGRCIPSYERIAERAGCAVRTVGRCLPDLEAAGAYTLGAQAQKAARARGWPPRYRRDRLARHAVE